MAVKIQRLRELADKAGIKTTRRLFIEARPDLVSKKETVFVDVPRSKEDLEQELIRRGLLPANEES